MDCGQPIRSERMPQAIVRPLQETGSFTNAIQFAARSFGNQATLHSTVRAKPRSKVWLYWNNSSTRALGLRALYLDVAASNIDFVPVKALNLGVSHPGECTNRKHW